jgi:hypothetical protein
MAWKRSVLDDFMRRHDGSDFMIWLKNEGRPLVEDDFSEEMDVFGVVGVGLYGLGDEIMVLGSDGSSEMWEVLSRYVVNRLELGLDVPVLEVVEWNGCEGERILLDGVELLRRAKAWHKYEYGIPIELIYKFD